MKTHKGYLVLVSSILLVAVCAPKPCFGELVPFESERWEKQAEVSRIEEYRGRTSLYLHNGATWIADDAFTNGVIEFDMAFSSARGFMGVMWRMKDPDNYEHFYIRPHQSGNPDANQYTPVFHGISSWQLYHGTGHGVALEYPYENWIHVRVVFAGSMAEVYVDSEDPVLMIPELKRKVGPGMIGLTASYAPAHFANFQYKTNDGIRLRGEPAVIETAPAGTIREWLISNTFSEADLSNGQEIPPDLAAGLEWTPLAADANGITNMARIQGVTRERDIAFARVTIRSEKAQTKQLDFGYSDRVWVYLNNRAVYSGSNSYRSRDYRYLGTIGLFDSVYLPLREGTNELWLAVGERFGGWGVLAQFPDDKGLDLRP